jgi:serine-type D-Ala-D-Ala carboxypeptidase (penicillin-binding protein 5/6)
MKMEKTRFNYLSISLLTCTLMMTAHEAFAEKTLDAMNSLTPAPITQTATANRPMIIPEAPQINAKAYALMDANSYKMIASNNADAHLSPASLTKLMTLYVVFDALKNGQIKLTDQVPISKKAWQTGGSRMFVQVGDQVPVKDLIDGVIIQSGNDSAVALAEYIGGTEDSFTSIMNQEAARLGLTESHFTDCNGLPHPDHYSSARDMALLAAHIINDFPEYYPLFSQKEFTYNKITQHNRNGLLWRYEAADGLKTGHTDEAGFCLVGSAKKDGMRLVSVVMGAPSSSERVGDSVALFNYGFRFYKTYKLYTAAEPIAQARIWEGENKKVPAGILKTLYVTIPAGQYNKLAANAVLNNPIYAPVSKGQSLGKLAITLDNKPLIQTPIVALQDDPRGGFITRLSDKLSRSLQNMFNKKKSKDEQA